MITKITSIVLFFWAITLNCYARTTQPDQANKSYSVKIIEEPDSTFSLLITLPSVDINRKNGGIIVEAKKIEKFVQALNKAKAEYTKLNQRHTNENIESINKNLRIKCEVKGYFMYGMQWQYQQSLYPRFHYSANQTGMEKKFILTMETGKLSSTEKWFVCSNGYNISFSSEQEIDDFISLINNDEINKLYKQS